jgi:hypothetical protein
LFKLKIIIVPTLGFSLELMYIISKVWVFMCFATRSVNSLNIIDMLYSEMVTEKLLPRAKLNSTCGQENL